MRLRPGIPDPSTWCRCVWDYAGTPEGRWCLFESLPNPANPSRFRLLTEDTAKSIPTHRIKVRIATLFLTPAGFGEGHDVCAYRHLADQFVRAEYRRGGRLFHRRPDCSQVCLAEFAGMLRMPTALRAKQERRRLYMQERERFLELLRRDIHALLRLAKREGAVPAVRLNGGSDIPWAMNTEGRALMQEFSSLQFYDYTKSVVLVRAYAARRTPRNWHVTWSWPGSHVLPSITREMLAATGIAVVFPVLPKKAGIRDPEPLPPSWRPPGLRESYRVEDGDLHDARWLDSRPGIVIGLRAKGEGSWVIDGRPVLGLQRQVLDLPPQRRTVFLARLEDRQERALQRARKAGAYRRKGKGWQTRGRVAARLDAIRGAFVGERISWEEAISGRAPADVMRWLVVQLCEATGARALASSPDHTDVDWSQARQERAEWRDIWPKGPPSYTLRVGGREVMMRRPRRKTWEPHPLSHVEIIRDLLGRIERAYPGLVRDAAENPELMVVNPQRRDEISASSLHALPAVRDGRLVVLRDVYRLRPKAARELNAPHAVAELWRELARKGDVPVDREAFVVFALDTRHALLGAFVASIGGRASSMVDTTVIGQALLATGATAWVVAHNHPSGYPQPSAEDWAVTRRLLELARIVGATLLDHVIVVMRGRRWDHRSLREMDEARFRLQRNPYPRERRRPLVIRSAGEAEEVFEEFHGTRPRKVRKIPRADTGSAAVALGRAVEVRYQPTEGERAGALWYHRFGDGVQLAATPDGRHLFFAPAKRGQKLVDWERGIIA